MPEIVDEIPSAPSAPSNAPSGAGRGSRVVNESMTLGSLHTQREGTSASHHEDAITSGQARGGRVLSEAAQRMLANIDKHGTVDDTAPATTIEDTTSSPQAPAGAAVAGAATTASPADVSSSHAPPAGAAAAPITPPITAETPTADALAAHKAENERLVAANRKLLADLESYKATPAREPSAREKVLDEAERMYLDDSLGAIRRLIATAIGVDDIKSKEVDDELSSVYQDLTERELSVPLDPARKATRDAARVRQILAREKRERKAETEAASKPAPQADERAAQATPLIGSRLTTKQADGKAIADRFPLMMTLAPELDGLKPEEAVWRVIQRDIAAGKLDPKQADDKLIEYASNEIETHYQALADKIGKARPQPSTAAPPQSSTDAKAPNADRVSPEVRTITNASASVAPATPPATKTESPAATTQPKYRNEKERRAALAAKHFG